MTLDTETFRRRAVGAHGDRYDYSKSRYVRKEVKLTILCPVHGEFRQRPDNHWNGHGCQLCAHDVWSAERTKKLDDFVRDARTVHGRKYDYGAVIYRGNDVKTSIGCPKHGAFRQTPNSHLRGNGCPKCSPTMKGTREVFVRRAIARHRGRYSYDKVVYVNRSTKVIVTCPQHGDFKVTPANHLFGGNGCPRCSRSKGEVAVEAWLEDQMIDFVPQKRFPTCRYKRTLPFDFYVPGHELLIEFDGDQHRGRHPWLDGTALEEVRMRDRIKDRWCRANGKLLLRIPRLNAVKSSLRAVLLGEVSTRVGKRVASEVERQLALIASFQEDSP